MNDNKLVPEHRRKTGWQVIVAGSRQRFLLQKLADTPQNPVFPDTDPENF
jgi:hypothetical protein